MAVQIVDYSRKNPGKIFRQDRFEQIIHGSVLESPFHIMKIVIAAQNHEGYRMQLFAQGMDEGDPVHAFHFYIRKYDLGLKAATEYQGIFPALTGTYLSYIRVLLLQKLAF